MLQTTQILNANTVLPRVEAIRRAYLRRIWKGERPNHLDSANMLADLRAIKYTIDDYLQYAWKKELISKSDPLVKEWERDAASRVRLARKFSEENTEKNYFDYVLGPQPEPQGSYPVFGIANIDDWDALRTSDIWKQLVETEGAGSIDTPTTLGRINQELARRLIARGYLNTYLVSLFIAPLAEGDINRLHGLPDRLDKIIDS